MITGQIDTCIIVLVELSLLPFSLIFEIHQSVQVILIVSSVSSGMESKREWITPGFKKWDTLIFLFYTVCRILSEGTENLFLAC